MKIANHSFIKGLICFNQLNFSIIERAEQRAELSDEEVDADNRKKVIFAAVKGHKS